LGERRGNAAACAASVFRPERIMNVFENVCRVKVGAVETNNAGSVELRRLAERGDAEAQARLGWMYLNGEGIPLDFAEGVRWTRLAANQHLARAQFCLGLLYQHGQGVSQDNVEAVKWYRLAAEQGLAQAQFNLGDAFLYGKGVPQNHTEAAKWYHICADQGLASAQYNLGRMYFFGHGVTKDQAAAMKWLRLAAEQDYTISQNFIGTVYANEDNYNEAAKWFRRASEKGDPDGQYKLAGLYHVGRGVSQDKLLARVWFALAASQQAPNNRAIPEQIPGSEIVDQIEKAEAGDVEAQRNLAIRLDGGDGIQRDPGAAALWVKRAAEGGDAWSQTTFAIELRKSKKVKDERESIRWLSMAADQGDPRAQFNLGLHHFLGVGTPVDVEAAAVSLLRASLRGFEDARKLFDENRPNIPEGSWESIFDRVKWPDLTFLMGPLAKGHLDKIREAQENDDGSDDAPWLEYERKAAEITFKGEGFLNIVFGEKVNAKEISVGRTLVEGQPVAAVAINLRNMVLESGLPVYWKPKDDDLEAAMAAIALFEGREWVRYVYM
jgi:TPR repeat protein